MSATPGVPLDDPRLLAPGADGAFGEVAVARAAQAVAGRAVRPAVVFATGALASLTPEEAEALADGALETLAAGEGAVLAVVPALREEVPGVPAAVPWVGTSASASARAEALEAWATTVVGVGAARLRHGARDGDPPGDDGRVAAAQRVLAEAGLPLPDRRSTWLAMVLAAMGKAGQSARARYGLRALGRDEDGGVPVMVEVRPAVGAAPVAWHSRDPLDGAPQTEGEVADLVRALETEAGDAVTAWIAEDGIVDVAPLTRSARAAVRIAVDRVLEGGQTREQALRRVDARTLEAVLRPVLADGAPRELLGQGVPASPGAAGGRVVLDPAEALAAGERGEAVVLVRAGTTPADVRAFGNVAAVITATGGQTSHAAVVARDRGVPCVVGVTDLFVDDGRGLFYLGDHVVRVGDEVTVDGSTGEILKGRVRTVAPPEADAALATLLSWADEVARVQVRANADTEADALRARELGAKGIGLCRTEHLFFDEDALFAMRRLLVAEEERARLEALAALAPGHRDNLRAILSVMSGHPVVIRLLDPPLEAFLPQDPSEAGAVASALGMSPSRLEARLKELRETNPVLGMRGVRVGVVLPALYAMQARAAIEAAADVVEAGGEAEPTLLVPMVASASELAWMREHLVEAVEGVLATRKVSVEYRIGAMIELPRACLRAGALTAHADLLSLGTNDLTQSTWGMSRDDHGRYAGAYLRAGLWGASPMTCLDHEGVGELVQIAVERARAARPSVTIAACGEHAADPDGVRWFHERGIDEVSCSPFRVPVARLAAAQAVLGTRS